MSLRQPSLAGGVEVSSPAARIVHVDLDVGASDILEPTSRKIMLIAHCEGAVVGHHWLDVPPDGLVTAAAQTSAIGRAFGPVIWHRRLRAALQEAVRRGAEQAQSAPPTVAVVVCTRDRPEQLASCLESVLALRTQPDELVVIDNAPSDERSRSVCARLGVRYVQEPLPGQSRARNRGIVETSSDLVAFTDDDCDAHPCWLDDLGSSFADPLVSCVTGYVGPAELESDAQVTFETHYTFGRKWYRTVYDSSTASPVMGAATAGAGANMIVRRSALARVGLFAEELGPGTPARSSDDKYLYYRLLAAGDRIVYEPERMIFHCHRRDLRSLERIMNDYGVSEFALASLCLARHREPAAFRIYRWWIGQFVRNLARVALRRRSRLPLRLVLAEIRGALWGPWAMALSIVSRRSIPPIAFECADRTASIQAPHVQPTLRVRAEPPEIAVAVASYQRRDELRVTLEDLGRQAYPVERFEVVVVLDGSTDGSGEMARSLDVPFVLRVIEQENRGLASARNRGAAESSAPVVVFLDDDIHAVPGFVAEHASAHRDGSEERVVFGYCPPAREATTLWAKALRAWWHDHYRAKEQPNHPWTFTDVTDGNMSLRRSLLARVGGYDESFDGGRRQDYELGIRLLEAGATCRFHRAATGMHNYDARFASALRNQRDSGRLDVMLASKHPHVLAQLPLANVARLLDNCADPSRWERGDAAFVRVTRMSVPVMNVLEAANLRGRWFNWANRLLFDAYTLGVVEALGTVAATREFLEPARVPESITSAFLALDVAAPFELPTAAGAVELATGAHGRSWAEVRAVPPGGHWDWDALVDRLAFAAGDAAWVDLADRSLTSFTAPLRRVGLEAAAGLSSVRSCDVR
jgi:glycosyltransferase involved in cell wall biosynthesis